ncbi:MAG: ATP-binding protein [Actinomycetia bacterium]|nr:ATP-binding protein [Actinomycetes bacterium]
MTIEFVKDVSLCVPSEPQYLRVIRQIAMVVGAKADLPLDCLDEGQLASDEAANILMKFSEPNAALYFDWGSQPGALHLRARTRCLLPELPDLPKTLEYAWVIISAITSHLDIFLAEDQVHIHLTVQSDI